MLKGSIKQLSPGCADGWYQLRAKGYLAAGLYWADENGPLPNWTSLAHFPIEPNGVGIYHMTGGRAVPAEATHVSLNCQSGCVERDHRGNLYINAGSIRPTTLKPEEPLQPSCWTEGNAVKLELGSDQIQVIGVCLKTGKYISRGYYRFLR